MNKRPFFGISFLLLSAAAFAADSPNFVVVFCDDLGYGDIGPGGNEIIDTPHLDRMADDGVTLTSFYASASVCTASRGGLLTGRYPMRLGIASTVAFPNNDIAMPNSEITIAEALKDQGYQTAAFGKWHLGHKPDEWPTSQGFDYFYGVPWSNDMNPFMLYRGTEIIEQPVDQTTLTERYTAEAVQFMEENKDEPFFVYLAHSMPHVPLFVSDKFKGRSEAGLYGDVIETIDWGVGEIFKTLDRLDLADDTLVIFTSDNGPWWEGSAGRFRDRKGSAWDGGQRVPFIARWPGVIPPNSDSDAITMNIDLFPTLVTLGGGTIPNDRPIDGKNILDVLKGSENSPHEYLYMFNKEDLAAVRTQRWKLVVESYYRGHKGRIGRKGYYYYPGLLFDMKNDPEERYSFTREHPDVAKQLRAWLDEGIENIKPPSS